MHTTPQYKGPAGPRWIPRPALYGHQVDGTGTSWTIQDIQQGGRIIKWLAPDGRRATTEATPAHPDYPSDELVLAAARDAKRAAKEAECRAGYYP